MWQVFILAAVEVLAGTPESVVPTAIPEIPRSFARKLTRAGCLVPQPQDLPGLNNVIAGAFAHVGQTDIAVLCVIGDRTDIRLYWGGSWHCASILAAADTRNFVQGNGHGHQGFSRALLVASPQEIRQYQGASVRADLPALEHSGIDDTFVGKGSEVHYCLDGNWVRFDGAD